MCRILTLKGIFAEGFQQKREYIRLSFLILNKGDLEGYILNMKCLDYEVELFNCSEKDWGQVFIFHVTRKFVKNEDLTPDCHIYPASATVTRMPPKETGPGGRTDGCTF